MTTGRRRLAAVLAATLLGTILVGAPAPAQQEDEEEPRVIDPYASEAPTHTSLDLAASVRVLDPRVRLLEPRVRSLRTEVQEGDQTVVTINTDVLFEFGSAQLTDTARRVVEDLAVQVAASSGDVLVVGHTDGIGSLEYNQTLSEQRAASVADVLRAGLGPARPLITEGRNFSEPVAPETVNGQDNPAGRAQNRRVEITFAAT